MHCDKEDVLSALELIAQYDRYSPIPASPADLLAKVNAWYEILRGIDYGDLLIPAVREWYKNPANAKKALSPAGIIGQIELLKVEIARRYRAQVKELGIDDASESVETARARSSAFLCAFLSVAEGKTMEEKLDELEAMREMFRRAREQPTVTTPLIVGRLRLRWAL